MRTRTMFKGVGLLGLIGALSAGGCASPAGVEVVNNTGRAINVEYLSVLGDGSTSTYSYGVAAKGSTIHYKVDQSGTNGAKIRFSLPEAPMDEGSAVTLKLSDSKTRYYDLEYRSGRLVARERFLGRPNPMKAE